MVGMGRVRQISSRYVVGGETGYTAQEDLKSVNSYDMGEGRTICVCFFVPAFQDPPWIYLLFSPWATTFLPSFIFRANSLTPVHTLFMSNYLPIAPLGIWELSLRRRGTMTTLASSGCTGVSWGSGLPLPASLSVCIYGGR